MSTIKFGLACDRCPARYNDYDCGDIVNCEHCGDDLCATCRFATDHRMVREVCCQECPDQAASCEPEEVAETR